MPSPGTKITSEFDSWIVARAEILPCNISFDLQTLSKTHFHFSAAFYPVLTAKGGITGRPHCAHSSVWFIYPACSPQTSLTIVLPRDFSPSHQFPLEGSVHETALFSLELVRLSRVFSPWHLFQRRHFWVIFPLCSWTVKTRDKDVVCAPKIIISVLLFPLSYVGSQEQTDWILVLETPAQPVIHHILHLHIAASAFQGSLPFSLCPIPTLSPLRRAIFCYIWQPRRSLEPLLDRDIPIPILLNTNNRAFCTHCCHQMFELSCLEQPGPLTACNVRV